MRVIATAGHTDHGKSTLLRALTGTDPNQHPNPGYAWTELSGLTVTLVDAPDHERFVPTMLAAAGPVPAVLFVVAADEGWMPQSAEHLAALDALGTRHGLLAVTRADLADPAPAIRQARTALADTTLAGIAAIAVSTITGRGLAELRNALTLLARSLPTPDRNADVRLWLDHVSTDPGTGTVVTGTLTAGTLRTSDRLLIASTGRRVRIRELRTLGAPADEVIAPARVEVTLRGAATDTIRPGDALLTPQAWLRTNEIDALLRTGTTELPRELILHAGSTSVPARVRPLGGRILRLRLARPLPLRVGDRALLRDPGQHLIIGGIDVADVRPPALTQTGAAHTRAAELTRLSTAPPSELAESLLRRTGFTTPAELRAMGLPNAGNEISPGWLADPELWATLPDRLTELLRAWRAEHPLEQGIPLGAAARHLSLPDPALLPPLAAEAGLTITDGRVGEPQPALPGSVDTAISAVEHDLAAEPFQAPDADRLAELHLGTSELGAAVRAGRLARLADGVYLLPDFDVQATSVLADLPQPFTLTTAKQALHTTRRVAVPLLESLDRKGITDLGTDDTRTLRAS